MRCTKCKTDNAPLKKTCENCGSILSGPTINNVTGEYGIRNNDGSFTPFEANDTQMYWNPNNFPELIITDKNLKPIAKINTEGYSSIKEFDCFPQRN